MLHREGRHWAGACVFLLRQRARLALGGQAPATNAKERLRELIDRYADAEVFDGDEVDGPAGNGFGGPH